MIKKTFLDSLYFLLFILLIFVFSCFFYTRLPISDNKNLHPETVLAQNAGDQNTEKVYERIRKAGLKPKEAKYYKVLE